MPAMSTWSALAAAIVSFGLFTGCGEVARGDDDDDGDGAEADAGAADARAPIDAVAADAQAVDGGPVEVTLSQSNSMSVTDGLGCTQTQTNYHAEMSFYRVFKRSDFELSGPFHISRVTFGLWSALAGGGATSQPAEIRIYEYAGVTGGDTLDFSKFTIVNSTAFQQANRTQVSVDVPVSTIIDGEVEVFVVELFVPYGINAMNQFLVGANVQGERAPSYYRAPTCGVASPTKLGTVGFPRPDYIVLLSVTGETE